eukprot:gnl/Trimastix_PCT/1934.p1 GENE.gnl/Trimastix_PCT/1934~~gnl/Trimastix_PCT/1934.p1  ORF type:complete len:830 (-),score=220.75 gnl/Trimastix_PCT/1934:772-3261(-)
MNSGETEADAARNFALVSKQLHDSMRIPVVKYLDGETGFNSFERVLNFQTGALKNMVLTNYRLILTPYAQSTYACTMNRPISIPYLLIDKISKPTLWKGERRKLFSIALILKDFRTFRFGIPAKAGRHHELHQSLVDKASQPMTGIFALNHFSASMHQTLLDGWSLYCAQSEMRRMRACPETGWRRTDLNMNYRVCRTYPAVLYVPATIDDETLLACAEFRYSSRIPVLSYRHRVNGAVICRSSQPRRGVTQGRSGPDEKILRTVAGKATLKILDCRPKINAVMNTFVKGGSETGSAYNFLDLEFLGIENIHAVRESKRRLVELCSDPTQLSSDRFLTALESTKWLLHLHTVLRGAVQATSAVMHGHAVLVHCTEGWDRTPQVVSLAMIMLDPVYRTFEGFCVLIEKEWCSMGHRFATRSGHFTDEASQRSPVFTQFLDGVYQIMRQHPTAFNFTPALLLALQKHVFSGRFGTFLSDCEQDRLKAGLPLTTHSVWTHLHQRFERFTNPAYQPYSGHLVVDPSQASLALWRPMYSGISHTQGATAGPPSVFDVTRAILDRAEAAELRLKKMETLFDQHVTALEQQLHEHGIAPLPWAPLTPAPPSPPQRALAAMPASPATFATASSASGEAAPPHLLVSRMETILSTPKCRMSLPRGVVPPVLPGLDRSDVAQGVRRRSRSVVTLPHHVIPEERPEPPPPVRPDPPPPLQEIPREAQTKAQTQQGQAPVPPSPGHEAEASAPSPASPVCEAPQPSESSPDALLGAAKAQDDASGPPPSSPPAEAPSQASPLALLPASVPNEHDGQVLSPGILFPTSLHAQPVGGESRSAP